MCEWTLIIALDRCELTSPAEVEVLWMTPHDPPCWLFTKVFTMVFHFLNVGIQIYLTMLHISVIFHDFYSNLSKKQQNFCVVEPHVFDGLNQTESSTTSDLWLFANQFNA
jgi:hypothetical protein